MKHLVWSYPVVCQTEKEDFIRIGPDIVGGEIISVKDTSNWKILKKIWRRDIHAYGRGFPFPELACFFAKRAVYTPWNDTLGSRWWTRLIRRFVFNKYERVIVQTEYGRKNLIKEGIDSKKIVVIPCAIDYGFFSKPMGGKGFRKKHKLGKEPFALAVGIRPLKNPDIILRACEEAGIKVVLVGPYEKKALEATWKGKGFEWYLPPKKIFKSKSAIFPGQLSAKELLAALDAATLFINSSDYECFGMAVYEAASAGLPLCLPDYGTFDVFKNAALFHNPKNHKQLSRNIKRYLESPKLRSVNGRKAKKIAKRFDYPIIRKKFEEFYKGFKLSS